MPEASKAKLIFKGQKALANGDVCLIINAGGHGSDSRYFRESKAWNKYDWKLDVMHLQAVLNKVKSIVEVAQKKVEEAAINQKGGKYSF
jgi:hypothetical protein